MSSSSLNIRHSDINVSLFFSRESFYTIQILAISRFALLSGVSEGYIMVKNVFGSSFRGYIYIFMSNFTPGLKKIKVRI